MTKHNRRRFLSGVCLGFALPAFVGCGGSGDVQLAREPPVEGTPTKKVEPPAPGKTPPRGVPGSIMTKNPLGGDPVGR